MAIFKKDKIFAKLSPVFEECEEIEKPKEFYDITGICKLFATNYNDTDVLAIAIQYGFELTGDNKGASKYHKLDGKHDVCLVFNKNDNSLMCTISRVR